MNRIRKPQLRITGPLVIIAFIAAVFLFCADAYCGDYEFQKGVCYTSWTSDRYASEHSDESLAEVKKLGAGWVSILTTWYQDKCFSTEIRPADNTPSDESIVHAINTAHSLGMKVMIKPHLDILDTSDGSWRGEIACTADPDWQLWFESYRDFIVHYARIAQENNVEMLCIGTELTSVSTIKEDMWKDIVIKAVRDAYKGPLTYAANWNDEYTHVKFWDVLDYVGIDAYFPLTEEENPNLKQIKEGWQEWAEELEEFQKQVDKPIIFPEVGYCSADWTAKTPWEELTSGTVNLKIQADCYEALFETFWKKKWFYGVYWWRWGTNIKFGGRNNRGFVFQNKPAQEVVRKWYKKRTPVKNMY